MRNALYYADNLKVLREHIPDESVDLVYLDPPFNSNASYNILFKERSGEESAAQIKAFEDIWHWGMEAERAYQDVLQNAQAPDEAAPLVDVNLRWVNTFCLKQAIDDSHTTFSTVVSF